MTFLCEFCGCEVAENDLRAAGPTTDEGYVCVSCYAKGKRKPGMSVDQQMKLPPDKTCADCIHVRRCVEVLGCTKPERTTCDFYPNLFRAVAVKVSQP